MLNIVPRKSQTHNIFQNHLPDKNVFVSKQSTFGTIESIFLSYLEEY